jgi:hypothetical protein
MSRFPWARRCRMGLRTATLAFRAALDWRPPGSPAPLRAPDRKTYRYPSSVDRGWRWMARPMRLSSPSRMSRPMRIPTKARRGFSVLTMVPPTPRVGPKAKRSPFRVRFRDRVAQSKASCWKGVSRKNWKPPEGVALNAGLWLVSYRRERLPLARAPRANRSAWGMLPGSGMILRRLKAGIPYSKLTSKAPAVKSGMAPLKSHLYPDPISWGSTLPLRASLTSPVSPTALSAAKRSGLKTNRPAPRVRVREGERTTLSLAYLHSTPSLTPACSQRLGRLVSSPATLTSTSGADHSHLRSWEALWGRRPWGVTAPTPSPKARPRSRGITPCLARAPRSTSSWYRAYTSQGSAGSTARRSTSSRRATTSRTRPVKTEASPSPTTSCPRRRSAVIPRPSSIRTRAG